jgi:hypothetical protein
MAELKTRKTDASVTDFLLSVEHGQRRADSLVLLDIFTQVTRMPAKLWGSSIVGFGEYHYESARSTAQGDWPLTGFSPRKRNMTVYIMPGFSAYQDLLAVLGKHRISVSCLYFGRLEHIDLKILQQLIRRSVADMKKRYRWNDGSAV